MRHQLLSAIIGLARATDGNTSPTETTQNIINESLLYYVSNNCDEQTSKIMIEKLHHEKDRLVPECSKCKSKCGRNDDMDLIIYHQQSPHLLEKREHLLSTIGKVISLGSNINITDEIQREIYKTLFRFGTPLSEAEIDQLNVELLKRYLMLKNYG